MLGDGIRRNIATISDEERTLFINAIKQLDDPTSMFVYPNNLGHEGADASGNITFWDMQEQIHKDAHAHGSDVHGGPAFAPWHRVLVNRFEALLRKVDSRLSLHYWDWTTDPRAGSPDWAVLFTPTFMGAAGASGGNPLGYAGPPLQDFESTEKTDTAHGGDGIHDHIWRAVGSANATGTGTPNLDSDSQILMAGNFTAFNTALQNAHNTAHGYIGGTIGGGINPAHFSFHDPFVFLLHSNMDRLWATWQRQPHQQGRLNPASAYGTVLVDEGLPANYFDEWVQPWAGIIGGIAGDPQNGMPGTDLNPWKSDATQQAHISYLDPSIIIPASYDTAPHSSYIIVNRDAFSTSEAQVTLTFPSAFFVVYEGFEPQEVGTPTVTNPAFTFKDAVSGNPLSTISAINPVVILEDPGGAADVPQRVTIAYDIQFSNTSEFPPNPGDIRRVNLRADLSYTVDTGTGGAVLNVHEVANTELSLVNQPNPFMVDVQGGNPSWLSVDTRVFKVITGGAIAGLPAITQGDADTDSTAPYTFIQGIVGGMNGWAAGRTDPSNPFNSLSPDETTSQLELSRNLGTPRVFNYAVARVRYLGPNTVDANNVSVFFRVFNTVVSALEYDHTSGTTGNYRRSGNVSGSVPLLGIQNGEIASIPFFAEARVDTSAASMTGQHDLTNTQTLTGIGTEQVAYFGCWLDINLASTDPLALQFPLNPAADPNGPNGPYTTPRQTIQTLIRGPHQCMVAEVFFWPTGTVGDPIPTGASPSSSDRLAQRNLAIDESGNPGWPVTHTVQHTFMVKPSAGIVKPIGFRDGTFSAVGAAEFGPDELMIRWTNVPRDSRATLYFPEVDADEILALNALRQHPAALQKVDTHTLQCSIADVSYVPLPGGRSGYLAGLMTLTLPDGIRAGKVFKLNVQQYSGVTRRILGAFQLTVPVKNEPEILPNETRKLSVMRYIQQSIPAGNRWALIFQRYVQQIADRVDAMGGDSTQVAPSPSGNGGMQAARCKLWARVAGTLLAGLVLALGTLTGCALTVVPPILAVLLVIVALVWINKCHPRQCWKLRTFISGAGLGAALLAILALAGIGAPQLVPVLCVVVILLAIAFLIGVIQKCF